VRFPAKYSTNELGTGGWGTLTLGRTEDLTQALHTLSVVGAWVTEQLQTRGDVAGAARGALFLRHVFPFHPESHANPDYEAASIPSVQHALNLLLGHNSYVYAGVDSLGAVVDARLKSSDEAG
jgi:hypothetical protein